MKLISATPITDEMVKKIQDILVSLSLEVKEILQQHEELLYTMKLEMTDYDWVEHGEGATEDSCRADAYLKVITTILNLQFPEHLYASVYGREDYEYIFYVYPDAEVRDIREHLIEPLLSDMQTCLSYSEGYDINMNMVLNRWTEWNGGHKSAFVPFYSLKDDKQVMLPYRIINKMCYPYNVATGRTYEEALARALVMQIRKSVAEHLGCAQETAWDEWRLRCPALYMLVNSFEPSPTGFVSEDFLRKLKEMCLAITEDVYVRDNSIEGVPSVCVYLPQVSPVMRENLFQEQKRKYVVDADDASPALSKYYGDFYDIYREALLGIYEDYPLSHEVLCTASTNELTAAYHIYRGDMASALSVLYQESNPCKHVQAIICELELRKEHVAPYKRNILLTMLFGKDVCDFIQKYWRNNSETFACFFDNIVDEPLEERLKRPTFPHRLLCLMNRARRRMMENR